MNDRITDRLGRLWAAIFTTFCVMARIHNRAPWRCETRLR